MMDRDEQKNYHMQFGVTLCLSVSRERDQNDELHFLAINQINTGGPEALRDPDKRPMIAQLNFEAGKRSIELSDFNTALQLFEHGIAFLPTDKWSVHYDSTLQLYVAAAETACSLNEAHKVTKLSHEVTANAKNFVDELACEYEKHLNSRRK